MERTQTLGMALMALSAVQVLIVTIGILRRSYLAIALPVFAAITALSGLLFWVGYTMVSMEPELQELDMAEEEGAEGQPASA